MSCWLALGFQILRPKVSLRVRILHGLIYLVMQSNANEARRCYPQDFYILDASGGYTN